MRWPTFAVLLVACKAQSSIGYLSPQVGGDHESSLGGLDTKLATAMLAAYHEQSLHEPPPLALAPTDGSELALRALDAEVTIEGPLAHTELHLTFHNTENRAREGRFSITMPPDAAVAKFEMKNADGWRRARIVTREQGRAIYESYLHKRVDPALLEQDLGNQFSARVFPIDANADKEIVIAYDQRVGAHEPYTLALKGLPVIDKSVIAIDRDGTPTKREQRRIAPEDVIVPAKGGDVVVGAGDEFVARIEVPAGTATADLDHVLVLVDTSASRATIMARQTDVVHQLLHELPTDATVVLAAYDGAVTELFHGAPRDAAALAPTALQQHGALGASDLGAALAYAANTGMSRVILVGDGAPTIGENEPAKLASIVGWSKISRVDAVRVGNTVDERTLHAIVTAGSQPGAIFDGRDIDRTARGLATALPAEQPIRVDGATSVWPATTRGLGPGDSVWVFGVRPPSPEPVTIHIGDRTTKIVGRYADETRVKRAVAGAHIRALGEELATTPELDRSQVEMEIERIALQNNLVSSRTSLLILENDYEEMRMLGPANPIPGTGSPVVDPTSTTQGITIDKNYVRNIPVPARTFEAALGAAAGSQGDGLGVSFSGTTSLENQYYVDGVNTTSLTFGSTAELMTIESRAPIIDPTSNTLVELDPPERIVRAMTESAMRDKQPAFTTWDPPSPKTEYVAPYAGAFKSVMVALHRGEKQRALEAATTWQLRSPGEVAALMALGEALEARGSSVLAARAYTSLLDLYPNRAELLRAAGERLDRVAGARPLAIDAYRRAIRERPDQASTYRLLAYDLMREDNMEALDVIEAAYGHGRFWSVNQLLTEDAQIIATYLAAHLPAQRAAIAKRYKLDDGMPSLRFVLSWETDGNDVDLHVRDRNGNHSYFEHPELASGGMLLQDVTDGYGPEIFQVNKPSAGPYRLGVHYFARGPEGVGLGSVQIIRTDGAGHVAIEDRPFVIQNDHSYIDLGLAD